MYRRGEFVYNPTLGNFCDLACMRFSSIEKYTFEENPKASFYLLLQPDDIDDVSSPITVCEVR